MEDLAKEIVDFLEDRPSKLQLVAIKRDLYTFHHVLRVSAPVDKGQLVFKVSYFDDYDHNSQEWVHLDYSKEDFEGVVGFIDAFLSKNYRSDEIANREY